MIKLSLRLAFAAVTLFATLWLIGGSTPTPASATDTSDRIVIFIQGHESKSLLQDCPTGDPDNMVERMSPYTNLFKALPNYHGLSDSQFRFFTYNTYCADGQTPLYSEGDSRREGVTGGATRLNSLVADLISSNSSVEIDIVAHSMGGAISSYWVSSVAGTSQLDNIHSVITFDGVLQGLEFWKASILITKICGIDNCPPGGLLGTSACIALFAATGAPCIPELTGTVQMYENSSVMQSIKADNPANKVPFVTIRGQNAGLGELNIGDLVTDSKSTFPGAWRDFLGQMGSHSLLWDSPCPFCQDLVLFAGSTTLHDSRDITGFAGSWGTSSQSFLAKSHGRLGDAGDTVSLTYQGSHAGLLYTGLPLNNGQVSIELDGDPAGVLSFAPCLDSAGSLASCRLGINAPCNGTHTITIEVLSGVLILDGIETNPDRIGLPSCNGGGGGGGGIITDSTPPVILVSLSPLANGSGWNNENVFVDWTVFDPESGIASTSGCNDTTLSSETNFTVLTCTATNGVGLSASRSTPPIRIDKTDTVTGAALDPPAPNGKRGWYISDVTVTLNAFDPTLSNGDPPSGVDTTKYRVNGGAWNTYSGPFIVSTESLDNVVEFFSDDVADNVESVKEVHFKLDKTPPEIELTGGELDGIDWPPERFIKGVLTNDPVLHIECNVTDNLFLHEVRAEDVDSGQTLATQLLVDDPPLTSSPCSLDIPLHEGINTIDIIVEDCAGWEDSVRIQVVYVVPVEHDPRTIGFWANAVKTDHYTQSELETFLSYINVASDVFGTELDGSTMKYGDVTPGNYRSILLPKGKTTAEERQRMQLLGDWLNMVSGRLTVIYGVAMGGVPTWPTVVDNTSGDPVTFALNVTYEVEEVIDSGTGTDAQFETGKNLLEGKNVGNLLDADEDGLPDQYEAAHLCLDAAIADALADPDGDGKTNAEEFALATDPCVPD